MHNGVKFDTCKPQWGTVAGKPAKFSFQMMGLWAHPKIISVSSKTQFMPSIQNTRKSWYGFDWNNCSLLTRYDVFQEDINSHIFHLFLPFPPVQPQGQQHRAWGGARSKHLGTPSTGPLEKRGTNSTFNLFLSVRKRFNPNLKPSYKLSLLLIFQKRFTP